MGDEPQAKRASLLTTVEVPLCSVILAVDVDSVSSDSVSTPLSRAAEHHVTQKPVAEDNDSILSGAMRLLPQAGFHLKANTATRIANQGMLQKTRYPCLISVGFLMEQRN